MGQLSQTPRGDTACPVPEADHLTFMGLLVGTYLAVFLCQVDLYIRRQGWVEIPSVYPLLASQVVMALIICYLNADQIGRILKASSGAILAFGGLAGLALVGAALPEANLSEGGLYVIYPTIDFLVFLLALPLASLFASGANWRVACGVAMCSLVMSILVDARYPGTFSMLEARAAGFGCNPNRGAELTVILFVCVLNWKKPSLSLVTLAWCLVAFVGVFMTLSRSGTLMLGIVGMLYVRQCVRRNGMGKMVVLGGLAFSIGGYALMAADGAKQILPMFDANHTRANLFNGQLDAMDTTEDSRVILIYDYLGMIAERPLLGWGTGYTYGQEFGSHNMYLARWVDNGLIGVVAYVMLLGMLFRIGRKHQSWECITVSVFLAADSFFTHNLLEDKTQLLIMGITAGRAILNAPQPVSAVNAVWGIGKISYAHPQKLAKAG